MNVSCTLMIPKAQVLSENMKQNYNKSSSKSKKKTKMKQQKTTKQNKQKQNKAKQKTQTLPLIALKSIVMCHDTIWSWNAEQILNLDYENLFRYNI